MEFKTSISTANCPPTGTGARALRVVAMGGGTGLSTLLKGLKRYVAGERSLAEASQGIGELCAVVTVTDDGGSSGRLRRDFNVLPPGDIRNCIAALSEDEALLSRLFQHRFSAGAGLVGHSFGNLFLTALTAITGDFAEAVKQSSEILATRGHIYPSTTSDVQLEAEMEDGTKVRGETNITASTGRIIAIRLVPADARPLPQTLEAIASADLITIGPGSLFTSLVPNMLVRG
ncbi:MAG TPA: gluconeogenesis factor YvcK family protein, partial [Terriglobales bacterium]|nr:gluconeogenesis factor YvcK family protein [Terriglobales bacterium]